MSCGQTFGGASDQSYRLLDGDTGTLEVGCQILAFQSFHREVGPTVGELPMSDVPNDPWMIEGCKNLCFAREAPALSVSIEHLDSDSEARALVRRAVNAPHGASASKGFAGKPSVNDVVNHP